MITYNLEIVNVVSILIEKCWFKTSISIIETKFDVSRVLYILYSISCSSKMYIWM